MFDEIYKWAISHIVHLLTAGNIALVFSAIAIIVPKLKKFFNSSEESVSTLTKRMNDIKELVENFKQFKIDIDTLKLHNAKDDDFQSEIKDFLDLIGKKVNAVLDIQDMAYGAVKVSDVKDSIKNIFANARFDTTSQRKKMAEKAREATAKIAELTNSVTKQLSDIEHTAEPKSIDNDSSTTISL